jgi:Flp pilus assembly protein TadG
MCTRFAAARRGALSILLATMIIPLLLIVGIAVDFSFYVEAQAELNLAADAAAMHAVRAMSMATANSTTYQNAGLLAGEQWFAAQAEQVPGVQLTGTGTPIPVTITTSYTAPTFTATVTYQGTINTIFGHLAGIKTWPIAGTATASISDNFVDIAILIDNSQSMLIGATSSDIAAMDAATPCAVVTATTSGALPGQPIEDYTYWLNGIQYVNGSPFPWQQQTLGYLAGETLPTYTGVNGAAPSPSTQFCDPNYIPGCAYPPGILYGSTGQYYLSKATGSNKVGACNNGGGAPGAAGPNTPQAPCAFACHQNTNGGDFYALARSTTNTTTGNKVQLRLDVVQAAAQSVITQMEQYSPSPQTLLGIGLYTFNSSFQPLYPCTTTTGCSTQFGTNLATAYSDLAICSGTQTTGCLLPPITSDSPNTDIADSFSQAATFLAGTAGTGASQSKAIKNLFIITDGISDWPSGSAAQVVGPIDQLVVNPCQQLKNQGFSVYVLYTPYYPLPTWTYSLGVNGASPVGTYPGGYTLQNFVTMANSTTFADYNANYSTDTPVMAALRACASDPAYFYTATNQADITAALNAMLSSALNASARVIN